MDIINCYGDARRAEAYARLEFPGTYYLAFRDLPEIIFEYTLPPKELSPGSGSRPCQAHSIGHKKALDFGCGAGRSTRFLQRLGFYAMGVDISGDMIRKAREIDPRGSYFLIEDGNLEGFKDNAFDLVLSAFAFDNIPSLEKKVNIFKELGSCLKDGGILVNLVSTPEIYTHEWVSFSTRDFPENKYSKGGDKVKIIITAIEDTRPVVDYICTDEEYQHIFYSTGLDLVKTYKPLGTDTDPYKWVNENKIAPWTIYVLKKNI